MNLRKPLVVVLVLLIVASAIPTTFAGMAGGGEDDEYKGYLGEAASCFEREWDEAEGFWGTVWFIVKSPVVGVQCGIVEPTYKAIKHYGWQFILGLIFEAFASLIKALLELLKLGLTYEPNWDDYDGILAIMMKLLLPFLFLQIIIVGAYLLFSSIDPGQRSRAKNMLTKLLTTLIMVGVAKPLYILTFEIINGLTNGIFQETFVILGSPGGFGSPMQVIGAVFAGVVLFAIASGIGITLLMWAGAYVLMAVLIIFFRWAMIILFYIIFPFTLFLYFFEYTRNLGGNLMMKTILWLSMGPVMALIISITVIALVNAIAPGTSHAAVASSLASGSATVPGTGGVIRPTGHPSQKPVVWESGFLSRFIALLMFFGGVTALIGVPLIMGGLMKWVGGALASSGMMGLADSGTTPERAKNMALITAGGMMMGQGSNSMVYAASTARYMQREAIAVREGQLMSSGGSGTQGGLGSNMGNQARQPRGILGNLGEIFARRENESEKYWNERNSGGMYGNVKPGAKGGVEGGVMSPQRGGSGGTAAGGGGTGGYGTAGGGGGGRTSGAAGVTSTGAGGGGDSGGPMVLRDSKEDKGEGIPPSQSGRLDMGNEFGEAVDGKGAPMSSDRDTYGARGAQGTFKSNEATVGILPSFNVIGRVDTFFRGAGEMAQGGWSLVTGKGQGRLVGAKMAARGIGRLLISAVPISPFMPIRMMGRVLLSISSSHLPPVMQPYTFWMGRKMMGLGFRQVMRRSTWTVQMGHYDARHAELAGQNKRMGVSTKDGKLADEERQTLMGKSPDQLTGDERKKLRNDAEMRDIEDKATGLMDRIGYGRGGYLSQVLPEENDFQAYQKHLNRLAEGNPGLYAAYVEKSMAGDMDANGVMKDALLANKDKTGVEDLWKKYETGGLDKKSEKEFNDTVEQAARHFGYGDVEEFKKSADFKRQFYTVGFMRSAGIKDDDMQKSFMEANPDLFKEDADGKLRRRRFMKLDSKLADTAKNNEYQTHEGGFTTLNLRLYRDRGGDVYMSGYDLKYVAGMAERDDWAKEKVMEDGFWLDTPLKTRYLRPDGSTKEVTIRSISKHKLTDGEKYGGEAVRVGGRKVRMVGRPNASSGEILVAEAEEWTGSAGIVRLDGYDKEKQPIWTNVTDREELENIAKPGADRSNYMIRDPAGGEHGDLLDITGGRTGPDGKVEFQFSTLTHYGTHDVPDEQGRLAMSPHSVTELADTQSAISAVMGMPDEWTMKKRLANGNVSAEEMKALLLEKDPTKYKPEDVQNMSTPQMQKAVEKLYDDQRKRFDEMVKARAKGHRQKAAQDAEARFGTHGITAADAMEADKRFQVYDHRKEELKEIIAKREKAEMDGDKEEEIKQRILSNTKRMEIESLTESDLMAVKAAALAAARRYGTKTRISYYSNERDINPMMVTFDGQDGERPHLHVNLAHATKYMDKYADGENMSPEEFQKARRKGVDEGMAEFIERSMRHYLPHELGGHPFAEKNGTRLMEETQRKYEQAGRQTEHRILTTSLDEERTGMLRAASSEMMADMFVEDNQSLAGLYGNIEQRMQGFQSLGQRDMLNAARVEALAEKRGMADAAAAMNGTVRARVTGGDRPDVPTGQYAQYMAAKSYFMTQYDIVQQDPEFQRRKAGTATA
jgi:hypothetical protein